MLFHIVMLSAAMARQQQASSGTVVAQHLFRGGDGLPSALHNPNATTFEIAGLVSLKGVSLAFAAMVGFD